MKSLIKLYQHQLWQSQTHLRVASCSCNVAVCSHIVPKACGSPTSYEIIFHNERVSPFTPRTSNTKSTYCCRFRFRFRFRCHSSFHLENVCLVPLFSVYYPANIFHTLLQLSLYLSVRPSVRLSVRLSPVSCLALILSSPVLLTQRWFRFPEPVMIYHEFTLNNAPKSIHKRKRVDSLHIDEFSGYV